MKTALVTGGSRGIGRAIVELFCERGYRVAFTYRQSKEAAHELSERTGALAIRADSADPSEIEAAVRCAISELGRIDILVNNAGVAEFSLFTEITLPMWQRMIEVNLTGAFLYTKGVLGDMLHRHAGSIINITSVWGEHGASCEVHYSTVKAGLIGMTRALAKELGPSGITVNAVAPGVIDTDMNARLSHEDIEALREQTPLCRIGTAREVAEAVYYLSSDAASFVTGEVLTVGGGFAI